MKHAALLLLCLSPAMGLWGSYPEDVYFFALNPAEWEFFASSEGSKLSVYRTLSIDGSSFSLNIQINASVKGEEFLYTLALDLDEKGGAFLRSFSDGYSSAAFAQPLLIFPSGGEAKQGRAVTLAKDITWKTPDISAEAYRNLGADVFCVLSMGGSSIGVSFRYQKGISGFTIGGQKFSPVTRRVFNSIK